MLKKKSIYRRPIVILGSLVLLMLLNLLVVNNPMFATKVSDLTGKTEQVGEMTPRKAMPSWLRWPTPSSLRRQPNWANKLRT